MDAYIASNSADLSDLLARISLNANDRKQLVTPMSSPRASYERRMSHRNDLAQGPQASPSNSSDYANSSFDRSIANMTIEEMARLNGQEIVEISTDEDTDNDGDTEDSRSPSPTELTLDFSCDPATRTRQVVLTESYDKGGKNEPFAALPHRPLALRLPPHLKPDLLIVSKLKMVLALYPDGIMRALPTSLSQLRSVSD
ncbi:hypothetical protein HWV62_44271 [Athelia sp. TMB]|nr:hypothetical protein HWV62_44271 [Athelia sp. TMB]